MLHTASYISSLVGCRPASTRRWVLAGYQASAPTCHSVDDRSIPGRNIFSQTLIEVSSNQAVYPDIVSYSSIRYSNWLVLEACLTHFCVLMFFSLPWNESLYQGSRSNIACLLPVQLASKNIFENVFRLMPKYVHTIDSKIFDNVVV